MLHKASWVGLECCTRIDASSHHVSSHAHSCSTVIIKSVLLKTSELPTKKKKLHESNHLWTTWNVVLNSDHLFLRLTTSKTNRKIVPASEIQCSYSFEQYWAPKNCLQLSTLFTALLTVCMDTIPIKWWISSRNEIEPLNCWKHNAYLPISWTLQSLQKRCM